MENSSELFTISVNGVLYLQVCGAVPTMQEVWGGGEWQVFRVTGHSTLRHTEVSVIA